MSWNEKFIQSDIFAHDIIFVSVLDVGLIGMFEINKTCSEKNLSDQGAKKYDRRGEFLQGKPGFHSKFRLI